VFHGCNVHEIQLVCHVCYVSVSYRIHDAATSQANEFHRGLSERSAAISYEAARVYSAHLRATFHLLHSSDCCTWLSVSLSVNHDCLQLLLLHVSRPTTASCTGSVSTRI